MILILLGIVFAAVGVFIIVCPKQATKKEDRENEAAVKKMRRNGFVLLIIAVLMMGLGIANLKKEVKCYSCNNMTTAPWYSNNEKNFCDECMERFEYLFGY